jgi:arylsulfatase A-like enzyme
MPLVLRHIFVFSLFLGAAGLGVAADAAAKKPNPNIVIILADDLGWGDLGCYGGKIATPHCDRLAREGMRFTDFHTTSSVCSPTRYSLLTGRYNWRTRLQNGVLYGASAPLIDRRRATLPEMLHGAGFRTAIVGKWHLGLGWARNSKDSPDNAQGGGIDFSRKLSDTPLQHGFDRSVIIAGSLDMPPFVTIDGDSLRGLPTVKKKYVREGLAAPEFDGEKCPELWAQEARKFITDSAAAKTPFFLYLALTCPHTPILPTAEFKGKSGLGDYADFVMETDWVVGRVLAALEEAGVAGETLVFFTSDNGCSPAAKIAPLEEKGHHPNGSWRGTKSDIWEGGHRVPLLARWPGKIPSGSQSGALACVVDFYATLREITGAPNPQEGAGGGGESPPAAPDSKSFAPVLLGSGDAKGRESLISHSIQGDFALRRQNWKLCLCPGSGGWSGRNKEAWGSADPDKPLSCVQLYDLKADPGETTNLAEKHPDKVADMARDLLAQIEQGPDRNDTAVKLHPKIAKARAALLELGAKAQ